jgi:hypothetical protein
MSKWLVLPTVVLAYIAATVSAAAPRDRDRDGMPDRWERKHNLAPGKPSARRDPDRDRLRNRREFRLRTHPRRADTDRDRLRDGAEVRRFHTNPRKRDTDGDGLRDRREIRRLHTKPRKRAGGCAGTPNTPDGPDPWGGCFPGPASTGVPPGTNLTPYAGPCTITVASTVIDSKTVNCYLEIRARGVVIRNSRINGHVRTAGSSSNYSFTITDSTVDAGPVDTTRTRGNNGNRALGDSNFTAIRVETIRGISGGFCEHNCTVRDSWLHGQDRDEGGYAHESGIRMGSGTGQHIVHTSLACDAPEVPPEAGCSADLTGYGDFATIQNNLIERNLFLSTGSGGFCAYGGSSASKPFPNGSNNVFRDNVFKRGPSGRCGVYGAITDLDAGQRGNQWINNRWGSGKLMPSEG